MGGQRGMFVPSLFRLEFSPTLLIYVVLFPGLNKTGLLHLLFLVHDVFSPPPRRLQYLDVATPMLPTLSLL